MDKLLEAEKYYKNKDFAEALTLYKEILRNKASLLKKYAICLKECMAYQEGIVFGEAYIKIIDPIDTDILLNTCICCGKIGLYIKALEYYKKILEINPEYSEEIGYYAYLLGRTGYYIQADELYRKAINREPENVWYISHYAVFLEENKKYNAAKLYYELALEKNHKNTWIIKKYAHFLYKLEGEERSYKYYTLLIEEEPTNWNYYVNFAELAIICGDEKKVFDLLKKSEKLKQTLEKRMVISFYWCVYFILSKKQTDLKNEVAKLSLYRKEYNGFFHRDFDNLEKDFLPQLDARQKENFKYISNILKNGG